MLMLVMFTVSIIPKRLLHDIFKTHKHSSTKILGNEKVNISKADFDCNCNEQIANSPCTLHKDATCVAILHLYKNFNVANNCNKLLKTYYFFELRGPPIIG